jgi:exopolyphosphatase/guanosine-5'-triphosphate,3'-diphosphate pyrophosphatase
MRAASIDIGTNTTLALLAEDSPDGLVTVKDELTPNHLGESMKDAPVVPFDIIALNVDLLGELIRDFRRDGAEAVAICATAALRLAQNRGDFIGAAREILGVEVELLSGREEAALTFAGAISGYEIYPNERVGVMDIGGGSTEVIEGRGANPVQSSSLDVGAVYLTNEFFKDDPPPPESVRALRESLRARLPQLLNNQRGDHMPWILVGGTPVTLAMLRRGVWRYDPHAVGGSLLTMDDVEQLAGQFSGKHSDELQNLPGMPATRGRYILAGTLLLAELMAALDIQEGIVSDRGLRHGFWLAKFGNVRAK